VIVLLLFCLNHFESPVLLGIVVTSLVLTQPYSIRLPYICMNAEFSVLFADFLVRTDCFLCTIKLKIRVILYFQSCGPKVKVSRARSTLIGVGFVSVRINAGCGGKGGRRTGLRSRFYTVPQRRERERERLPHTYTPPLIEAEAHRVLSGEGWGGGRTQRGTFQI
jgi:hypothetical protein